MAAEYSERLPRRYRRDVQFDLRYWPAAWAASNVELDNGRPALPYASPLRYLDLDSRFCEKKQHETLSTAMTKYSWTSSSTSKSIVGTTSLRSFTKTSTGVKKHASAPFCTGLPA